MQLASTSPLGLGVDPSTKTCTGPSPPSPSPAPPGPPPPPRPPVPAGQCSALMSGMTLVNGDHAQTWPKTDSADACETLCKSNKTCTYGTWHDPQQGRYANACLLKTDNQYHPKRMSGHTSFVCNTTGTVGRIPDPPPHGMWWAPEDRRLDQQAPRSKGWRSSVPPVDAAASTATSLYVDASKGSDSAAGTIDAPLQSIQAAVDKAALTTASSNGAGAGGDAAGAGATSIFLRAGTFYLPAPVVIKASGVTIGPYQNEDVTVSGGVQLAPSWTKTASVAYKSAGKPSPPPPAYDT